MAQAIAFYERAGSGVRVYRDGDGDPGDGFAFVDYDGQSVFDLDRVDIDAARNGAGCYLITRDADAWHERIPPPACQLLQSPTNRGACGSSTLTDPSGNHVRIGRGVDD